MELAHPIGPAWLSPLIGEEARDLVTGRTNGGIRMAKGTEIVRDTRLILSEVEDTAIGVSVELDRNTETIKAAREKVCAPRCWPHH